ncbi:hypothetical protein TruAng_012105 [Truncatella angustata]|nr:hypothetical protein TruAng_012105 [Truncatella angustata]
MTSRTMKEQVLTRLTAIAEALIAEGANVESTDTKGNTPIYYATNASFLLERGAQINGNLEKNKQGPLVSLIRIHYLQRHGWTATPSKWYTTTYSVGTDGVLKFGDMTPDTLSTIHYLVESGVEVSPRLSDPRRLPLAHAIHYRQPAIVKALLDAGADPNPSYTVNGLTETYLFLTEAIYYSTPEIAQLLLNAGAAVDETPGSSQEALILALSCLPTREREYLRLAGEVCERIQDINRLVKGQSALWWAIKNGKFYIAKLLIQKGAYWGAKGIFLRAKIVENLLQALILGDS